jgi:hypothetical protein
VVPAITPHQDAYRAAKLRNRKLGLIPMILAVLDLLWRQTGSLREEGRILRREGAWAMPALDVSDAAFMARLSTFPSRFFHATFQTLCAVIQARAQARPRTFPLVLRRVQAHFPQILAADGSTLDALLRKLGRLREALVHPLAGRIITLRDVVTQLPQALDYLADPVGNDHAWWPWLPAHLPAEALLLIDQGFRAYAQFDRLTDASVWFVTPLFARAATQPVQVLQDQRGVWDVRIHLGQDNKTRCQHDYRLITFQIDGTCYRYVTNVLDPDRLTAADVIAIYEYRWSIEDAFLVVKRVLGLAYFHGAAPDAIQSQFWATFLRYLLLVDLSDAVASYVQWPLEAISQALLLRGLYHFREAVLRGEPRSVIVYLAEERDLGVVIRTHALVHRFATLLIARGLLDTS